MFLTARDSDFDVVSGLRVGADDYLTKGVSLPHLMARIGALFRRVDALAEAKPVEERIVRGDLELDLKRFSAHVEGRAASSSRSPSSGSCIRSRAIPATSRAATS